MEKELLRRYCAIILKKIVTDIAANQRKKERATDTALQTAENGAEVRTMRHWRAAAGIEHYYAEIERGFNEMAQLDAITGWSDNLHQDRFKFMSAKYAGVLAEYRERGV
ncbi:phage protein [Geomicrobium sp. JCM 19037]|uniref:DUF1140 family protein n=1 Tax=Geomicrobium sp. JCM 19037 TaxID=1460634 RepID=UPI00045F2B17|nr:DUF1140 family protein [Geomicrobium sp. JCM 19037]GAK03275.1 phage protein [Geomicrobium sp. JCM 19037]